MLNVRYVGRKPIKTDNVAHTGVVWCGNGDVQQVHADAWEKLSKFPDVWEIVENVEAPITKPTGLSLADADAPPNDPAADPLAGLTDAQVRDFAKRGGFTVHHKLAGENLRAKVRELMAA